MYEPVSNKADFAKAEHEVLAFWKAHDTFAKSLTLRRGAPEFVFYDGPPFATGLPHYGHLLAGTIKDIVPRYHTMRGHYVEVDIDNHPRRCVMRGMLHGERPTAAGPTRTCGG